MLSLTSEYALRAMVYLARHADDWPIPGRRIAQEAGIPSKYLSSVLGDLVRAGILAASPGRRGGFRMVRAPETVPLYDILVLFESTLKSRRPCPFGNAVCSDENPCGGHDQWKRVQQAFSLFLRDTSVRDVAAGSNGRGRKAGRKRKST